MKDADGNALKPGWYWYEHNSRPRKYYPVEVSQGASDVDKHKFYFTLDGSWQYIGHQNDFSLYEAIMPPHKSAAAKTTVSK